MYGDVKLVAVCSKWTASLVLLLKLRSIRYTFELLPGQQAERLDSAHHKTSFFLRHERWKYGKHKVLSSETDTLQKAVSSHGRRKNVQLGRLRKLPLG